MKFTPHIDYRALCEQSLKDLGDRDLMIALLQKNSTRLVEQHYQLGLLAGELSEKINDRDRHIAKQDVIICLQNKTINSQDERNAQQEKIISDQNNLIQSQQVSLGKNIREIASLKMAKYELKMYKKLVHGRKSEKFHGSINANGPLKAGDQLRFDMEVDAIAVCHIHNAKRIAAHTRYNKTITDKMPHPGRNEWPKDLPREVITLEPKNIPEGAKFLRYDEQIQLACRQMKFFLQVFRRAIYMAEAEEPGTFKQLIAPLPPHPIPRCKADISLLVSLAIDKYLYHLPTNRQQARFKQFGVDLKYSTLTNWLNRIPDVLEPLYEVLMKELIVSGYIMMDETTYRVLDDQKQTGKKSHIGYLWGCANPIQGMVAFNYQRGRGKKDVQHILSGYKGYLQTDAYSAYTKYGRQPGVIHLLCLSHARRYFCESRSNDLRRSDYALANFFGPLYAIEAECRQAGLSYDEISEKRAVESTVILDSFHKWLQMELNNVIPKTPIHKAIAYTLRQFNELRVYLTDGMLQIDNNYMERQIRPIAVGRRSYMFAGSHRGGQRAAIIYSLLGTCKLQGIDPSLWLDDVLRRITAQPQEKLVELLPQCWKPIASNSEVVVKLTA